MKKQLLLILMMVLPLVASADDSGECGNGVTYYFNESTGTLTISKTGEGDGKMYARLNKWPWLSYSPYIQSIVIDDGVTNIGASAFSSENNKCGAKNISIPNSVTTIENSAFAYCANLSSINIPESVTFIDDDAFKGCSSLTSLSIPNGVNEIRLRTFEGCTNLASINFPSSLTSIGVCAFYNCSNLKSINIPNEVSIIGYSAFYGCSSLTSINVPNKVERIERYTFFGCSSLTSIVIPSGVNYIGNDAFENCSSLISINIPNGIQSIEPYLFAGCTSLKTINIPYSINSISGYAFKNCFSLESIKVDEGNSIYDSRNNCNAIIETNTNSLFIGCKNTTIPNSVKSIYSYAFWGSGIKSITIPKTINKIYNAAFSGCIELESIKVDEGNIFYDSRDNCNAILERNTNTLLIGCKTTKIPESVKKIGDRAFYDLSNLESITIPKNVESIENSAFWNCRLKNVVAKNINVKLVKYAFSDVTMQHAILYVPAGQRWDAIYGEGGLYQFNNIRELATTNNEISQSKAYTLMNTDDYRFAVYDVVNNKVTDAETLYDVDETNPSNGWQIVKDTNNTFLYNIGARKYAKVSADGQLLLSSVPVAINIQESDNGFKLGNSNKQWGFVINENLRPVENLTAIDAITVSSSPNEYFSVDGQRVEQPRRGLNIVKMADGKTKKVIMK